MSQKILNERDTKPFVAYFLVDLLVKISGAPRILAVDMDQVKSGMLACNYFARDIILYTI